MPFLSSSTFPYAVTDRWFLWFRFSLSLSPRSGWPSTQCPRSNTRFCDPCFKSVWVVDCLLWRTRRGMRWTIPSWLWSRRFAYPGSPSSICSGAQNLTIYVLWHFHYCEIFILVKLTNVQICRLPKKVWVCEKRDECDRRAGNPSLLCLSLHYGRGRGCQLCQYQIIATWASR